MSSSEFEIIDRYFKVISRSREGVVLGPGDDCAVLSFPSDAEVCTSTDTLLEGVHFPEGADASLVASRLVGANLSDLAAMGAEPHSCLIALTLAEVDAGWLGRFSSSLSEQLQRFDMVLIGGNLARGQLSLSMTVIGTVPIGQSVQRQGAKVGDDIYVTGTLGDAARGLKELLAGGETDDFLVCRYAEPTPRIEIGMKLRRLASSMIDVSDGLLADLCHLCEASEVGAIVDLSDVPISENLARALGESEARRQALNAGDDYELCFTASSGMGPAVSAIAKDVGITRIGRITADCRLEVTDKDGLAVTIPDMGYKHF